MKIALLSAALLAAAFGVAPSASADTVEDQFLATLQAGGFNLIDDATSQALVELGYGLCSGLDAGASPTDAYLDLLENTEWPDTGVGYFIGAATSSFCPEYFDTALEELEAFEG